MVQHANEAFQKMLEEQKELENEAESELSGIQLEEANIRQKVEFAQTNVERINGDLEKFETEKTGLLENAKNSKEDVESCGIQRRSLLLAAMGFGKQTFHEHSSKRTDVWEFRGIFRKQEEISEQWPLSGNDRPYFMAEIMTVIIHPMSRIQCYPQLIML